MLCPARHGFQAIKNTGNISVADTLQKFSARCNAHIRPNMAFVEAMNAFDLEGNPDFVKLAEAYGIQGYHIRRTADIDKILTRAFDHEGPVVIHCHCEKEDNVFPMIPAGASLEEMLIEAPRHKLAKPTGST